MIVYNILDDFFGEQQYPTELQYLIMDYVNALITGTEVYFNKAVPFTTLIDNLYRKELFGKNTEDDYNTMMDFVYLLIVLVMIYYKKEMDYNANGKYDTPANYATIYHLECFRQTMMCVGFNLIPLFSIFGVDYTHTSVKDGIGYMHIAPNTTGDPTNRIF